MSITASKSVPSKTINWTVSEVHIIPGANQITIVAHSDDPDVKIRHKPIDITAKIDAMTTAKLNGINDFINSAVADLLEVGDSEVIGELFSKSS